jgi:ABC-type spermidine/putrescine transport system permease subunit II
VSGVSARGQGVVSRLPWVGRRENSHTVLWVFLAFVLLFTLLPLIMVFVYSVSSSAYGEWPPPGVTTRWYEKVLEQREFVASTEFSVVIAAASSALGVLCGGLAAFAVWRWGGKTTAFIQALLFLPLAAPKIALGLAGFLLFQQIGVYGSFLEIVPFHAVLILPFSMAIIGASLMRLDRSVEEAGRDLGASMFQTITRVIIPQIRTSLIVSALLGFMISFDEFDATIILANPSHPTFTVALFNYIQKFADPSAAALATVLVVASLIVVSIAWLLMRRAGRVTDLAPGSHA